MSDRRRVTALLKEASQLETEISSIELLQENDVSIKVATYTFRVETEGWKREIIRLLKADRQEKLNVINKKLKQFNL